mgnify:FL=1
MAEEITRKGDGKSGVEIALFNDYPHFKLVFYRRNLPVRTEQYETEQAARVDMAMAFKFPALFEEYGAVKDWPKDAVPT